MTYDWHVSNPAGTDVSNAYDVILTDTLHADTTYVTNSLVVSSGCPSGVTLDDSAVPVLTATWSQLAAGEDCRVRYDVVLNLSLIHI